MKGKNYDLDPLTKHQQELLFGVRREIIPKVVFDKTSTYIKKLILVSCMWTLSLLYLGRAPYVQFIMLSFSSERVDASLIKIPHFNEIAGCSGWNLGRITMPITGNEASPKNREFVAMVLYTREAFIKSPLLFPEKTMGPDYASKTPKQRAEHLERLTSDSNFKGEALNKEGHFTLESALLQPNCPYYRIPGVLLLESESYVSTIAIAIVQLERLMNNREILEKDFPTIYEVFDLFAKRWTHPDEPIISVSARELLADIDLILKAFAKGEYKSEKTGTVISLKEGTSDFIRIPLDYNRDIFFQPDCSALKNILEALFMDSGSVLKHREMLKRQISDPTCTIRSNAYFIELDTIARDAKQHISQNVHHGSNALVLGNETPQPRVYVVSIAIYQLKRLMDNKEILEKDFLKIYPFLDKLAAGESLEDFKTNENKLELSTELDLILKAFAAGEYEVPKRGQDGRIIVNSNKLSKEPRVIKNLKKGSSDIIDVPLEEGAAIAHVRPDCSALKDFLLGTLN